MQVRHIFISSGHNYFGHHGRAPDNHPLVEVREVECVTGRGIRGDRFYDYKDDYKGQITFFSLEVFGNLARHFNLTDKSPGALRRNVVTSGIDLNDLIGEEFSIQGVHLRGTAHCRPCYWLDQAVVQGAEAFLKGNGGLRAQILSDGVISVGDAKLILAAPRLLEC
ncbi:MAG TPA: MOSC domain-containing protein [Chthoniobacterales bacterium]|jgi:MOSC domain-containing protein YiiM|nr:MOSC domain-containing protein [Chthoniobacterales bacterium]